MGLLYMSFRIMICESGVSVRLEFSDSAKLEESTGAVANDTERLNSLCKCRGIVRMRFGMGEIFVERGNG